MKKIFVLGLVLIVVLTMIFVGCNDEGSVVEAELKDPRFEEIYRTSVKNGWTTVIRDKETGVEYLFVKYGYGAGLCPLCDENGNIIVSETSGKEGVGNEM